MPYGSYLTPNPLLTKWSQGMFQDRTVFVGDFVAPRMKSDGETGVYKKLNYDELGNHAMFPYSAGNLELVRMPNAIPARIKATYADGTYQCLEKSLEEPVSWRELAAARKRGSVMQPKQEATQRIGDILLTEREIRVASMVTNPANFTNKLDVSSTTQWDQPNSNPIEEIKAMILSVKLSCGRVPKYAITDDQTMNALQNNSEFQDRVKYTGGTASPSLVTEQTVAALFRLKEFRVATAMRNTADLGLAGALGDIWSEIFLVFHKPDAMGLKTDMLAMSPEYQMIQTRTYREERPKSDVIESSHIDTELLTNELCGGLLYDTLA